MITRLHVRDTRTNNLRRNGIYEQNIGRSTRFLNKHIPFIISSSDLMDIIGYNYARGFIGEIISKTLMSQLPDSMLE